MMTATFTPDKEVCIIIVTHNRPFILGELLRQIYNVMDNKYHVIVVNTGDENLVESLKTFPEGSYMGVRFENVSNIYWSAAVLWGMTICEDFYPKCKYVVLLNDDLSFDSDFIQEMLVFAEPNRVLSPKIYDMDGNLWYNGGRINWLTGNVYHYTGIEYYPHPAWLTGMGLIIPVDIIHKYWGLDYSNFPMYLADTDYTMRLKFRGVELYQTPVAIREKTLMSIQRQIRISGSYNTWEILTDVRSSDNFKIRYRFYRRWWNVWFFVPMMVFYMKFFAKRIYRILKMDCRDILRLD